MDDAHLPESLRRRDERSSILEDIAPYIGSTLEERDRIMSQLCRLAAEQCASRPDSERLVRWQDPRSPESERLWLALVKRYQRR